MQAAIGCAQLKKLPEFVRARRYNFAYLLERMKKLEKFFVLPEPCPNSDPSWFGFLLTCREGVDRNHVVSCLEEHNIQTRMLFSGNLTKHPCFDGMRKSGEGYRIVGGLDNTDIIMRDTFWIGVYPGMTEEMLDYMVKVIGEACGR